VFTAVCSKAAVYLSLKQEKGDFKMEPITLCGLIIVMFGFWVEFEPALRSITNTIYKSSVFSGVISNSTVQKPVYVSRMPICLAKAFHN